MLKRDPLANPEPLMRRVYAYVAYRIGAGPEAEDVTSDTFERGLRYRDSFDPRKGSPAAWLIGIARRCIDDELRGRVASDGDPPETAAPGSVEQDVIDRLDLAEDTVRRLFVRSAVACLDEQSRELIALRYGADLTARQIAELLGMRTNAVEVALHRALARLRPLLDVESESAEPAAQPVRTFSPQ